MYSYTPDVAKLIIIIRVLKWNAFALSILFYLKDLDNHIYDSFNDR